MRSMMKLLFVLGSACTLANGQSPDLPVRPRARDIGITVGVLPTGPLNAITDVMGVAVGQVTVIEGDNIRTGVTVILPHTGNLFKEKVPGAVVVGNGFGKLVGSTQVNELGEIETPIALTSTLSVPRVADALISYMLALPENRDVLSVNPLVGETNDGALNDIRGRHITPEEVFAAINGARGGPVEEGAVGAGTGTVAFGFKAGIGTSSRRLPAALGGYTIGVLVQSNFGGVLSIAGAPVGVELGRYYLKDSLGAAAARPASDTQHRPRLPADNGIASDGGSANAANVRKEDIADGSIMMVVATDAPLDQRNLRRLASRALMGVARTGSSGSNGSGDYVIAFSTAPELRIHSEERLHPVRQSSESTLPAKIPILGNDSMSPLFLAVIEATEEAIYNSLLRATTMTGNGLTVEALPIAKTVEILRRHSVLNRQK